jgi:cytochrome c-type biogenesis protein CcmH/NrfG
MMRPIGTAMAAMMLAASMARGATPTEQALARCTEAARQDGARREAALREGLAMARQALAENPGDARAHLAEFCNLGRLTQANGVGLSALPAVRRLTQTIETAERLAPNDPDVLAARGAYLLALPRLLGGDPATGESLLRRALALAPSNCEAAGRLAQALASDGRSDEAAVLLGHC